MKGPKLYVLIAVIVVVPNVIAWWAVSRRPVPSSPPYKPVRTSVPSRVTEPPLRTTRPSPPTATRPTPSHVTPPSPPPPLRKPPPTPRPKEPDVSLDVDEIVAIIQDTSRSPEKRRDMVTEMARKDPLAVQQALMIVGDGDTNLAPLAVELLGVSRTREAEDYLQEKFCSPDLDIARAAIRGYVDHRGERALPALAKVFSRADSNPTAALQQVCTGIVERMGAMAVPEAIPSLSAELQNFNTRGWPPQYGSAIVRALAAIGSKEANTAIKKYADLMTRRASSHKDNPEAQKRYAAMAEEARAALR